MQPIDRRKALALAGAGLLVGRGAARAETVTLPFANGERPLVQYPASAPWCG